MRVASWKTSLGCLSVFSRVVVPPRSKTIALYFPSGSEIEATWPKWTFAGNELYVMANDDGFYIVWIKMKKEMLFAGNSEFPENSEDRPIKFLAHWLSPPRINRRLFLSKMPHPCSLARLLHDKRNSNPHSDNELRVSRRAHSATGSRPGEQSTREERLSK